MLSWINESLTQQGVAVARSQPQLQQPVGTLLPGADATVQQGYKVPAHIALLLPADGDYAPASASIREGFFSAYMEAARNHAPRPSVRVYNSHGTPDGSVAGYKQAVADGAQLVVGPLTRGDVAAVFAQPSLPVPLLALNHPDNRKLPAGGTSEFGLLPETEGAQAADHMVERGITRAYVVISNDDFAQRAAGAFKVELLARGGQIAGMNSLGDFSKASVSSLNLPSTPFNNADSAGANADAPASDDTDGNGNGGNTGIFISMRPPQARLLIPQLLIANIHLPVFATSHIYAGNDDAIANSDLNGVEFCDAPWLFNAQPGMPSRDDIATKLPSARGGAGRLFAFGMDAWNLVPYLDWLRAHPGSYLPGASGQLAADSFGRIGRVLIWAKFQDGLARPLSGSLQMNDVPQSLLPGDLPATPIPPAQPAATPTPVTDN